MAIGQGAQLEVEIEKAVFRGLSLARHDGQVVLVRGAYPGERWRVRIIETGRQFLRAEAEEPLATHPARRPAGCPCFVSCGGCAYQDLGYDAQLALKREVLSDALTRSRAPCPTPIGVVGSPERGWRTRASLHVETRRDGVHLGLTAAGSHHVIDFETCAHFSERLNDLVSNLRSTLGREPELAAQLRGVELAESQAGDVRVAALVGEPCGREVERVTGLFGRIPGLDGVGVLGARHGRPRYRHLAGETHVGGRVAGSHLRAHVLAFFQANRFLLDSLTAEVAAGVPAGGHVLDLYGGVGLFSVTLAPRAERVVCVEIDPLSAEDARANARRAGRANMSVVASDVRQALEREPRRGAERIVLDPPRTGLGAGVVERVVERRPDAIVYVSCDPPTLGRDLARLAAGGYRVTRVAALDLFPNTFHIEAVAHLERGV